MIYCCLSQNSPVYPQFPIKVSEQSKQNQSAIDSPKSSEILFERKKVQSLDVWKSVRKSIDCFTHRFVCLNGTCWIILFSITYWLNNVWHVSKEATRRPRSVRIEPWVPISPALYILEIDIVNRVSRSELWVNFTSCLRSEWERLEEISTKKRRSPEVERILRFLRS